MTQNTTVWLHFLLTFRRISILKQTNHFLIVDVEIFPEISDLDWLEDRGIDGLPGLLRDQNGSSICFQLDLLFENFAKQKSQETSFIFTEEDFYWF